MKYLRDVACQKLERYVWICKSYKTMLIHFFWTRYINTVLLPLRWVKMIINFIFRVAYEIFAILHRWQVRCRRTTVTHLHWSPDIHCRGPTRNDVFLSLTRHRALPDFTRCLLRSGFLKIRDRPTPSHPSRILHSELSLLSWLTADLEGNKGFPQPPGDSGCPIILKSPWNFKTQTHN